jgi:hypothetical protein
MATLETKIHSLTAFSNDPKYDHQKLARELEIWRNLSGGNNIVELLGVMTGIGPLPSLVCEFCPWNLQDVGENMINLNRFKRLNT